MYQVQSCYNHIFGIKHDWNKVYVIIYKIILLLSKLQYYSRD